MQTSAAAGYISINSGARSEPVALFSTASTYLPTCFSAGAKQKLAPRWGRGRRPAGAYSFSQRPARAPDLRPWGPVIWYSTYSTYTPVTLGCCSGSSSLSTYFRSSEMGTAAAGFWKERNASSGIFTFWAHHYAVNTQSESYISGPRANFRRACGCSFRGQGVSLLCWVALDGFWKR